MILELDIGNTRVKWRVRETDGRIAGRGACVLEALLDDGEPLPEPGAVHRLRGSCVRGAAVEGQLAEWAGARGIGVVQFARTEVRAGGVTSAYCEPARLGVDRWLAMLAAYSAERAAVFVIQCGSAITVDLVDTGGQHVGGLIAPGIRLMERSLLTDTDGVRFAADPGEALETAPGRDTAACVRSGVANAAAGLIERACASWRPACPDARVLICGGDAPRIAPLLGFDSRLCPELVLDGLAVALP